MLASESVYKLQEALVARLDSDDSDDFYRAMNELTRIFGLDKLPMPASPDPSQKPDTKDGWTQ